MEPSIHIMKHQAHAFIKANSERDKVGAIEEMAITLIRFTREVYLENGIEYNQEYIFDDDDDGDQQKDENKQEEDEDEDDDVVSDDDEDKED